MREYIYAVWSHLENGQRMGGTRIFLPLALGVAVLGLGSVFANPAFNSSEIEGQGSELIFCDLDGDNLQDAVLVDGLKLSIFFQDPKGFTQRPYQLYQLEERPCLIWSARLGRIGESLLLMTSEGVTALDFTNRNAPPIRRQIIKQKTVVPEALKEPQVKYFPLSVRTAGEWPLIMVPVADGFQIWQQRNGWRQAQIIEQAVENHIRPLVDSSGYSQSFGLNVSLGDINGDGREDLMVMRNDAGGIEHYALYLQRPDGLFSPEPAYGYTNQSDWHSALSWVDINGDGKVDLIKSTFLDELFFVPGMRSGKVLVGAYLADEHGRIPVEPQYIFRKHDWSSALPVVDVDGDGLMDMVVGYIPINPREARKAITGQQIDFNLKFYFFRPGSGFLKEPDCQRDLLLHFNNELFFTAERRLYYEQFISLNGDFNGDGKKDLLAKDHKDEISVYFFISREKGFSPEADLRFKCPEPMDWWEVKDLNGDGVSDLVIKLQDRKGFRIFTSKGEARRRWEIEDGR